MSTTVEELMELEKKIAIMQGYVFDEEAKLWSLPGEWLKSSSTIPYCRRIDSAWNLFEDMCDGVLMNFTKDTSPRYESDYKFGCIPYKGGKMEIANKAPEAIARAWVKWKEGK